MIESPTPTWAEGSGAATALYDGADAIMHSAENAAGMVSPGKRTHVPPRTMRVNATDAIRIILPRACDARQYPKESVFMQQRIINRVKSDHHYTAYLQNTRPKISNGSSTSTMILAARLIARHVNAKCIASFTVGGDTARKAFMKWPDQPILAISLLMEM